MSTVLNQAAKRVEEVQTNGQSTQTQIIEAMKQDISYQVYERAKKQLPVIEQAIHTTYRPFLDQLASIAGKAKVSLPTQVEGWLRDMHNLCTNVPRQVREGINGWEQLAVPIGPDGRGVNLAVRAQVVHGIRTSLNSWDGCASHLAFLKGQIEQYVQESRWPAA